MKKFKVMLSVFMVLIIVSISVAPTFAIIASEDSVSSVVWWSDKIDEVLVEKMNTASEDEKIPVWVWFTDIDKSNIETMVEKETGLTKDDLSVKIDVSTEDLISALDVASVENTETARNNVADEMKIYLEATKKTRKQERELLNTYLRSKRSILSRMYVESNNSSVKELDINNKDILFQSRLTPCAIVNITKDEIVDLAESSSVESINYYDTSSQEAPDYENEKDTMQVDAVYEQYGNTGEYVNVLMNDHGFIRSNLSHYNDIKNPLYIRNIYNKTMYHVTNTSVLPNDVYPTESHPNLVASVLQSYAEDVSIYATCHSRFEDIEWAIEHCDIHLINASANYANPLSYNGDSYSKWFDALVSQYDVTLIASAGNSQEWSGYNWPYVISPACGYNSIAVGAYITNGMFSGDTMQDFRYSPTQSTSIPCYKPDVVVAAGSTSRGAPVLSGIVSMMLEIKPSLASQPEVIKAILMASCHRKVKPTTGDTQELIINGLTQKQGAGAVDAYRALKIVIDGTYGASTVTSPGVSPTASFALADNDDINVSIAWSRENINNSVLNTTLGTLQELELRVYNGNNLLGSSLKTNAGKQMVYLENLSPNTTYSIRVNKTTNNVEPVTYGYAWSTKNYNEVIMNLDGITTVGKTITVSAKSVDDKEIELKENSYIWKKSTDGITWQVVPGENSNTYTLENEDLFCYLQCEAEILDNVVTEQSTVLGTTTLVIKLGDADLDGSVSVFDVTLIQRYLAKLETLNDDQLVAADVDGDGSVSVIDSTYIQQYLSKIITVFPAEQN